MQFTSLAKCIVALLVFGLFVIGCNDRNNESSILEGHANFRDSMLVPEDSTFEAAIVDISDSNGSAKVIAKYESKNAGQPPYRYRISFNRSDLKSDRQYILRAKVTHNDVVLFASQEDYRVSASQVSSIPSVVLVKIQNPNVDSSTERARFNEKAAEWEDAITEKSRELRDDISSKGREIGEQLETQGQNLGRDIKEKADELSADLKVKGAAALEATRESLSREYELQDTHWRLVSSDGVRIDPNDALREPHIIFHKAENRLNGSDGCNTLSGSYSVTGSKITYGAVARTRMGCNKGQDIAESLNKALIGESTFTLSGDELRLKDSVTGIETVFKASIL